MSLEAEGGIVVLTWQSGQTVDLPSSLHETAKFRVSIHGRRSVKARDRRQPCNHGDVSVLQKRYVQKGTWSLDIRMSKRPWEKPKSWLNRHYIFRLKHPTQKPEVYWNNCLFIWREWKPTSTEQVNLWQLGVAVAVSMTSIGARLVTQHQVCLPLLYVVHKTVGSFY